MRKDSKVQLAVNSNDIGCATVVYDRTSNKPNARMNVIPDDELCEYIANLVSDLLLLAERHRKPFLAYILNMALLEASALARNTQKALPSCQ